jgi:hypothetical protein
MVVFIGSLQSNKFAISTTDGRRAAEPRSRNQSEPGKKMEAKISGKRNGGKRIKRQRFSLCFFAPL